MATQRDPKPMTQAMRVALMLARKKRLARLKAAKENQQQQS